ncbi:MAG: lipopolysaccharide biosynthesis protein [Phycisphaerae bacterium]
MSSVTAKLHKLRGLVERVIPMGPFARSVAVVGGGTGLGYGIVLAASPIVTRLYSPTDFGVFGVYMSIVAMALIVISWRYELAIPAPEDDNRAANVLVLALTLVVCMSAVIGVGLWLLGSVLLYWLDAPSLRPYLWLVPLNTLIGGFYGALQVWCVRKKSFAAIARSKLSQAVGAVVVQVGIGLFLLGPLGLLISHIVRWGGGSTTLGRAVWRGSAASLKQVSPKGVLDVARQYHRFPMFSMWSALLNNVSAQSPILLLSAFFGGTPVGWFVLTSQVLRTPLVFVGQAISQVFFSSASEASRKGQTAGITLRVFTGLMSIAAPYVALLMITAPEVFGLIFGRAWTMAGVFAQFLGPWLLIVFAATPVTSLVYVLERQRGDLVFQTCLLLGRVVVLTIGGQRHDVLLAMALFGAVSAAMWFVYMLWLLHVSGNHPRDGLICMGKSLAAALPVVLPAAAAKLLFGTPLWVMAGLIISGAWATANVVKGLRNRERSS